VALGRLGDQGHEVGRLRRGGRLGRAEEEAVEGAGEALDLALDDGQAAAAVPARLAAQEREALPADDRERGPQVVQHLRRAAGRRGGAGLGERGHQASSGSSR
jgi:hypothetical protein